MAFQRLTSLYDDYGLDLAFDFSNRFRSGEMPIAITDFSAYNQMSIFAPEIDGLWSMMPVPGVVDENGNQTALSGTAEVSYDYPNETITVSCGDIVFEFLFTEENFICKCNKKFLLEFKTRLENTSDFFPFFPLVESIKEIN